MKTDVTTPHLSVAPLQLCLLSISSSSSSRRRPNRDRCVSRGAWRQPVRRTRTTWCAKSGAFSMQITVTMSSANVSCCCAYTAIRAPTRSYNGRWRCASYRDCRSTAFGSNVSPGRRSVSRISRRRSPTSFSFSDAVVFVRSIDRSTESLECRWCHCIPLVACSHQPWCHVVTDTCRCTCTIFALAENYVDLLLHEVNGVICCAVRYEMALEFGSGIISVFWLCTVLRIIWISIK